MKSITIQIQIEGADSPEAIVHVECEERQEVRAKFNTSIPFASVEAATPWKPDGSGWITPQCRKLFKMFQRISLSNYLCKSRTEFQNSEEFHSNPGPSTARRSNQIDNYVAMSVLFETSLIILAWIFEHHQWRWWLWILPAYRILEIVIITVGINVFDQMEMRKRINYVASAQRMLLLSVVNYFELALCFGLIYGLNIGSVITGNGVPASFLNSIYFSAITQMTIGYGDFVPTGFTKLTASLQGFIGLLFSMLIFARFVGLLPPIISESENK